MSPTSATTTPTPTETLATTPISTKTLFDRNESYLTSPEPTKEIFQTSFARRLSLTPKGRGSSRSQSSSESPKKEVIEYTVSIKLQGSSSPEKRPSPEKPSSRLVDIKLTDDDGADVGGNHNDDDDDVIRNVGIPIPVLHYPKRDQVPTEKPPRPNSIPVISNSLGFDSDEARPKTWRQIPISKVDKSPTFEIPTFSFGGAQQNFQPPEENLGDEAKVEIEELDASEASNPAHQVECRVDDQGADHQRATAMPKSRSFVEFEELSDESSGPEEDVDNDGDKETDLDESESEPDDDDHQGNLEDQDSQVDSQPSGSRHDSKDESGDEQEPEDPGLEEEEEDEESFATCGSDLSFKVSSKRSPSTHRSRKSKTASPPLEFYQHQQQLQHQFQQLQEQQQQQLQQQHQHQQQQLLHEVNIVEKTKENLNRSHVVDNIPNEEPDKKEEAAYESWDKTEVEVSDIEEEAEIPDMESMAENLNIEMCKLKAGETPTIVSRYLSRLEREKSETESEDESFETFRKMRMRSDREAAAPERDITEDDTETAEFQTKLRQLGSNSSSASTTQRDVVCADASTSCDTTTPDVSAAATLSTEGKDDNKEAEDKGGEIIRSRSQEIYLQRKNFSNRKKFPGIPPVRPSPDVADILSQQLTVDSPMVEEEEEGISQSDQVVQPPFNLPPTQEEKLVQEPQVELVKSDSKLFKEGRPLSTEGLKADSANSSTSSLNALRHSRSFDSGLPMSPEVRRRLKAISQRSPSELSLLERKRSSLTSALTGSTTTPSPGRQSIEDLASSVENLREKLSLFPFTGRPAKLPFGEAGEEEELDLVPQLLNFQGGLTRSRSWQGFGAAHRAARHQAFWDSNRYEQVTDKDLSLPPPPASKPPEAPMPASSSNSSLNDSGKSIPPPTGRIGRLGAISRRYRPLAGSPSSSPLRSSPLRYQKRSLTIPLRSPLAQPPEKSASYDGEINSETDQSGNAAGMEKALSLSNLPTRNADKQPEAAVLNLSESLKLLNSSKTREKRNGLNSEAVKRSPGSNKFCLPGALSLDSISTTSRIVQPFDDERPREWSPKKRKKVVDSSKLAAIDLDSSSSSDDDDDNGNLSGEEFSFECNPPPIETVVQPETKAADETAQQPPADLVAASNEEQTKSIEATQQVMFRQHYLSIIQEEEEHSDANGNTPGSSRASSRPSSIYGGLPNFNPSDLKEMFKGLNGPSKDSENKDLGCEVNKSENNSPLFKSKMIKGDMSVEDATSGNSSSTTVNAILTNSSTMTSQDEKKFCPESLQQILRKLPPPPKQPPSLKPLWSPDRRKKFSPDVKTASPEESVIAEEQSEQPNQPELPPQLQPEPSRVIENLKRFNQQMNENLRSLSSSSSSLSFDELQSDSRRLSTPPSPKKSSGPSPLLSSPKVSPPRNSTAPYSPLVGCKASPKLNPRLARQSSSSSQSSTSLSSSSTKPDESSPKPSPLMSRKPPSSPKLPRSGDQSPKATRSSPRLNPKLRTPPKMSPPKLLIDLGVIPKKSLEPEVKVSVQTAATAPSPVAKETLSDQRSQVRLQPEEKKLPDLSNLKKLTPEIKLDKRGKEGKQEPQVQDVQPLRKDPRPASSVLPVKPGPASDLEKSKLASNDVVPAAGDKMRGRSNLARSSITEQHLTRAEETQPRPGYPDSLERSRTLDRGRVGRSPVVPQPQGLAKVGHLAEAHQTESLESPDTNQKDEVSLEELIKKYNGPRNSERFSMRSQSKEVMPSVEPPSQRSVDTSSTRSVANKGSRMRSISCQRPPTISDASIETSSSSSTSTSTSGKFSSMRELLKNVVSSQKNVQQQKMEFAQKNGKQTGDDHFISSTLV